MLVRRSEATLPGYAAQDIDMRSGRSGTGSEGACHKNLTLPTLFLHLGFEPKLAEYKEVLKYFSENRLFLSDNKDQEQKVKLYPSVLALGTVQCVSGRD